MRVNTAVNWQRLFLFPAINLALICLAGILHLWVRQFVALKSLQCPKLTFFDKTFPYSYKTYNFDDHNVYAGASNDQTVKNAWKNLVGPGTFRMNEAEIRTMGMWRGDNVPFEDGGEYLAYVNVYHELHCLEWIKTAYLNPGSDAYRDKHEVPHLDHCLDFMRQESMCRADLSVSSWEWKDADYTTSWPRKYSQRLCIDFEQLTAWLRPRVRDPGDHFVKPSGEVVDYRGILYAASYELGY